MKKVWHYVLFVLLVGFLVNAPLDVLSQRLPEPKGRPNYATRPKGKFRKKKPSKNRRYNVKKSRRDYRDRRRIQEGMRIKQTALPQQSHPADRPRVVLYRWI
jgi:hypothetical protein